MWFLSVAVPMNERDDAFRINAKTPRCEGNAGGTGLEFAWVWDQEAARIWATVFS